MKSISELSRPASSVTHYKRVIKTITRADIAEVNKSIEPKIWQNRMERTLARKD